MPTWLTPTQQPHYCSQAFQGRMPPKRTAWQSWHLEKATQGWKAWLGLSKCKAVTGRLTDTYSRNRQWDSCVIVWMKRAGVQLIDWQALLARAVPVLSKVKKTLASSQLGKSSSLSISSPKPGTLCLPGAWPALPLSHLPPQLPPHMQDLEKLTPANKSCKHTITKRLWGHFSVTLIATQESLNPSCFP